MITGKESVVGKRMLVLVLAVACGAAAMACGFANLIAPSEAEVIEVVFVNHTDFKALFTIKGLYDTAVEPQGRKIAPGVVVSPNDKLEIRAFRYAGVALMATKTCTYTGKATVKPYEAGYQFVPAAVTGQTTTEVVCTGGWK